MKGETFTNPSVEKLLNDNFVTIWINPEKQGTARFTGEELSYKQLADKLGVDGYPANFFFDADGKLLGGQPGYMPSDMFAQVAEYVGKGFYKEYSFSEYQALPADKK